MNEKGIYVLLMVAAAFLAAVSQIFLKKSAQKEHRGILQEYVNGYVLSGYALLMVSMVMNMVAYQEIEYRYGPVINASSYVFVLVLGWLFLHEKITAKRLWGNVLIVIGILISVV